MGRVTVSRGKAVNEAVAMDVAVQVARDFPLTDRGKGYAHKWALYVLRLSDARNARKKNLPARPRCPFNMVAGGRIRADVTRAVAEELKRRDLNMLHADARDAR